MAIKNFIEELEWRGMIHTIMPGAKEQLEKEMTTAYLGIDPTADSLHIGHLVGVMILKHFQMCGHRPIALVGGATGMIGDPSGKSQERNLLDEETLRRNQEAIKRQLAKLIDFDSDAPNAALMVNNYDWMKGIGFLDFIRDIGKLITVNYMMAKDSVKKRFNGEGDGMSFTEFSYQLVQGFGLVGSEMCIRDRPKPMRSPARSSRRPTAPSSARPRAATCGSIRAIRRPTSSTSSGST